MSREFEAFLARIYVDDAFRAAFLADPRGAAAGLSEDEIASLEAIDRHGLALAAASFAHKRERARQRRPSRPPLRARLLASAGRWLARFRSPSRAGRRGSSC